MSELVLHRGGELVTLDQLDLIQLPKATETYVPVSHFGLANKLKVMSQDLLKGFTLSKESYGVARQGQQLFGILRFQNGDPNIGMSLGFRNSYDQSMSIGICLGANVFVCDNLAFSGGIAIMRKHTKNVWDELEERTIAVLYKENYRYGQIVDDAHRFEALEMNDDEGFRQLGALFGHGVIGPRQLVVAKDEWIHSSHEEFNARNAWSLYNCVTEALKSSAPNAIMENHVQVHEHFKGLVPA